MPLTVRLRPEEGGEGLERPGETHAADDSGEEDDADVPPPKGQSFGKARRRQKGVHRRVRSLGDLEYLDLEY